jgi:chromosome segregation ATPase
MLMKPQQVLGNRGQSMDWLVAGPYIVAGIALLGTCYTAWLQWAAAEQAHKVAHAAQVINGYDQLCKALRAELACKGEEIDKLRYRIIEIERRESEWTVEKAQLEDRIRKLEEERNQLKGLLDELYDQTCGGKG